MDNHIRTLRTERGWSQADLARRLGVSRQTVNAIENGRYDPSLPLAFRVARAFGRPIEGIFADPDGPPACMNSAPQPAPQSETGPSGTHPREGPTDG